MFQNKADTSTSSSRAGEISISDSGVSRSVIDKDLIIVGNAFSKGELTVNGDFEGDIRCSILKVGQRAVVTGNLYADEIVISGDVDGQIHGKRVVLQGTSRITGDIHHDSLSIEQGAVFKGVSHQNDATVDAKPAAAAKTKVAA